VISMSDALELPPGVRLTDDGLRDDVLDQTHPANSTARIFLEAASRGATLEEALADVTQAFDVDPRAARLDLLVTAARLNRHFLLNVRRTSWRSRLQSWLEMPSAIMVTRRWPGVARRSPAIRGFRSACTETALAVVAGTVPILAAMALPLFGLALLAIPSQLPAVTLLALSFVASLIIHEWGHAFALVGRRAPFFVAADGWRVAVVHRPPASAWVAAAGPLTAACVGLAIAAIACELRAPIALLASIPFAGQLVWLVPITHDGRSVLHALKGEEVLIRLAVRTIVSIVVCYLVLFIGLSILGAVAFASPGVNWDVGIGPMPLFSAHSDGHGTSFSMGWGVLVVAIVLGILNSAAGAALAARRGRRSKQVTA